MSLVSDLHSDHHMSRVFHQVTVLTKARVTRARKRGAINQLIIFLAPSGGARVFAARGKRLCCDSPPHPVAYLEIRNLKSFQILAYFSQ